MLTFAAAFFALSACGHSQSDEGPSLFVTVLPGGARCEVRNVKLDCGSVATYLRETLQIPSDTYIAVTVPAHTPIHSDSMTAVIDELRKAGFTSVIGQIPLSRSGS